MLKPNNNHICCRILNRNSGTSRKKYSVNIMVVDDEPDALFTYECFLSAEGYNVEAFTDPQEALKHFVQLSASSSYYQLVLLDIGMPKLNGLQLFNTIKT